MWRRFLNFAVVLSAVLSVITVALWARSYGRTDRLHVALFGDHAIVSSRGRLYVLVFGRTRDGVAPCSAVARIDDSFGGWEPLLVDRQWFGFLFVTGSDRAGLCRIVSTPHAAVAGMLAALAGIVPVTRIRHRHRAQRGCCTTCGYDLSATPD